MLEKGVPAEREVGGKKRRGFGGVVGGAYKKRGVGTRYGGWGSLVIVGPFMGRGQGGRGSRLTGEEASLAWGGHRDCRFGGNFRKKTLFKEEKKKHGGGEGYVRGESFTGV